MHSELEIYLSMGRPTKLTPHLKTKVREACILGATNAEIAYMANITEKTLYNYFSQDEKFLQQVNAWKQEPLLKARKTIIDNLDQPRIAMWFIERKSKESDNNAAGSGVARNLDGLSDDMLRRIIMLGSEA